MGRDRNHPVLCRRGSRSLNTAILLQPTWAFPKLLCYCCREHAGIRVRIGVAAFISSARLSTGSSRNDKQASRHGPMPSFSGGVDETHERGPDH
jgi:hypothetical protein